MALPLRTTTTLPTIARVAALTWQQGELVAMRSFLDTFLPPREAPRVGDLGSGNGEWGRFFARRYPAGHVWVIDQGPIPSTELRHNMTPLGGYRLEEILREAALSTLPFPPFDLTYVIFPPPKKADRFISAAMAVTAPGGTIQMITEDEEVASKARRQWRQKGYRVQKGPLPSSVMPKIGFMRVRYFDHTLYWVAARNMAARK